MVERPGERPARRRVPERRNDMEDKVVQEAKDQVVPEGKWKFDDAVTNAFDDMLERSIPQYGIMRDAVFELGSRFLETNGAHVVDLGCSRGEALARFVDRFGARHRYVGVEISEPMLAAARERFSGWECVRIEKLDLRREYPMPRAALTLSVLTAMFVPVEHRSNLFRKMFENTAQGGAVILVEKVLGEGAENDSAFVDVYLKMKRANGYSDEQVERKRLALEGVLVPLTARWNEEMLRWAGFSRVECFWRWMNFAAWIGVRR